MIGMRMRLEMPLDCQIFFAHIRNDCACRFFSKCGLKKS